MKKQAEIKNDTLYIEGKPVQHCYFTKDYYWVSANNSINLSDSRLFGFVPKDHIIGKASLIWFSKESETGLFGGIAGNVSSVPYNRKGEIVRELTKE